MSLLQLRLPPDDIKPNRRWPSGTYLCRAIGEPEKGLPLTRLVIFKGEERTEKSVSIELVSIEKEERDLSIIRINAPEGLIPLKSELGDDDIVCIMQENTPRCEECGLNLVKRFDPRKQEPYMVCPANRWGLNRCENADRHDMNCRRESQEEKKKRLEDQSEYYRNGPHWGEKYGLEFKSYEDYLQSDLWNQKKKTALSVLGNRCQICKDKRGITVHHVSYDRIGKELIEDLSALCRPCHKMVHALISENPKQYSLENCVLKILNMTVKEFFATKQRMENTPEWGLNYVDLNEVDRETAEVVTDSWKRFPATQPQNGLLKKLGYDGPPLNKKEAFFKIKELKGEEFKAAPPPPQTNKTPQENSVPQIEDLCFLQDISETSRLN